MESRTDKCQKSLVKEADPQASQLRILGMLERMSTDEEIEWTDCCEDLWLEFIKNVTDQHISAMTLEKGSKKKAEKLTRSGWAYVDQLTKQIETTEDQKLCPANGVPVVLVHQNGRFRIHPEVESPLRDHPWIARNLPPADYWRGECHFVAKIRALKRAARSAGIGINKYDSAESLAHPELMHASACAGAATFLEEALDPSYNPAHAWDIPEEDLGWMITARKGSRLWRLLYLAMEAGAALERYRTFHDQTIEQGTILSITNPPGKQDSSQREAVERASRAFIKENPTESPTPVKLLKWMKGTRPKNPKDTKEMLTFSNPDFAEVFKETNWKQFQDFVNNNNKRIKKQTSRTPK